MIAGIDSNFVAAITHTYGCYTEVLEVYSVIDGSVIMSFEVEGGQVKPGVNFINILHANFSYKHLFSSFSLVTCK
jgi:hypothetical protein